MAFAGAETRRRASRVSACATAALGGTQRRFGGADLAGAAGELCREDRALRLLEAGLVAVERRLGVVELRLRGDAALEQRLLALMLVPRELGLRLRPLLLGAQHGDLLRPLHRRLEVRELRFGLAQPRLGLVLLRDLHRRFEPEQELALAGVVAGLEEAQRAILAAQLTGRSGEIGAAEAALRAAEAAVAQAETRLARRRVAAPANAKVQDVFFRAGEVVNAGQPVLSLLPPQNLRLRFYVPEPVLATFALGQTVAVACDSCPAGIEAKVSFISREAEYTPPVIFSEQERAKLVFRIEARPAGAMNLPIGLPVSVRPLPGERP